MRRPEPVGIGHPHAEVRLLEEQPAAWPKPGHHPPQESGVRPRAFAEIGDDRDNKVVILTGSGDVFRDEIDGASLGEIFEPGEWDKIYWEGRRVLQRLLEIEAPLIAAVNGP